MIEFTGYLTGKAEKGFVRKSQKVGFGIMIFAVAFMLPIVFYMSRTIFHDMIFFYAMCGGCVLFVAIPFVPKGEKEHRAILPKRIYVKEDCIVCTADRYTESKFIQDVSKVIDHGEYYELCFPFGKLSEKFICQKSLLTRGTLEEFEALFEGKITKK